LLSLHSIAIFVPIFRIGSGSAIIHLIFSFDPAFSFWRAPSFLYCDGLIFLNKSNDIGFRSNYIIISHGLTLLSMSCFNLPPFTLVNPFSAHKQPCGSEARALRAKSIGGERNPAGALPVLPQNEAGESGAQVGVPTSESTGSQEKEKLARPVPC
jgi:hypothetical protein